MCGISLPYIYCEEVSTLSFITVLTKRLNFLAPMWKCNIFKIFVLLHIFWLLEKKNFRIEDIYGAKFELIFCNLHTFYPVIQWTRSDPLAGLFWPTVCMFDTPVIKGPEPEPVLLRQVAREDLPGILSQELLKDGCEGNHGLSGAQLGALHHALLVINKEVSTAWQYRSALLCARFGWALCSEVSHEAVNQFAQVPADNQVWTAKSTQVHKHTHTHKCTPTPTHTEGWLD